MDEIDTRRATRLMRRFSTQRDEQAREELIAIYTPLARRLARRYRSPYEPFEDLVQVALMGLIGALDRFDPDRGVAFSSFAIPTILGELKRYFRTTGWAAHVPRGAQELSLRVDRAAREIAGESGRPATAPQIAQQLETSVEDVLVGLEAKSAHYAESLDAPAGSEDDDAFTVADRLGSQEGGFALADTKLSLAATMHRLPHLERRALRLRIDGDLRQNEIAEIMECSQMQVSRLLRRAAVRVRAMTDPAPKPVRDEPADQSVPSRRRTSGRRQRPPTWPASPVA